QILNKFSVQVIINIRFCRMGNNKAVAKRIIGVESNGKSLDKIQLIRVYFNTASFSTAYNQFVILIIGFGYPKTDGFFLYQGACEIINKKRTTLAGQSV